MSDFVVHPEIDSIRHKSKLSRLLIYLTVLLGIFSAAGFYIWNYTANTSASSAISAESASETAKITTYKKEVIGFLPYWSVAQNIEVNTDKLTQLIYFGLPVGENGDIVKKNKDGEILTEWSYFVSDQFAEIRDEAKRDNTKVLLAIKNFDSAKMNSIMRNKKAIQNLSDQLAVLIKEYDLDGVNINFEYMTYDESPAVLYMNDFVSSLSQNLRKKFPEIIISFDVYPSAVLGDTTYDMVKIGQEVDQVIIMGYDYHRVESTSAGPVGPLYEEENILSIDDSVKSLYGRVDHNKIILAIPFYGYEWQTTSRGYKSKTLPGTGAVATYERVQNLITNRDDVILHWNEKTLSPWLVYTQSGAIKQVYYEDKKSIGKKMEYVKENKIGGVGIWAIGYEGENYDLWDVIESGLEN